VFPTYIPAGQVQRHGTHDQHGVNDDERDLGAVVLDDRHLILEEDGDKTNLHTLSQHRLFISASYSYIGKEET